MLEATAERHDGSTSIMGYRGKAHTPFFVCDAGVARAVRKSGYLQHFLFKPLIFLPTSNPLQNSAGYAFLPRLIPEPPARPTQVWGREKGPEAAMGRNWAPVPVVRAAEASSGPGPPQGDTVPTPAYQDRLSYFWSWYFCLSGAKSHWALGCLFSLKMVVAHSTVRK